MRYGGLLSITLLFCITIYGMYKLSYNPINNNFYNYLLSIIFTSSLYYLISNGVIQSRIIYNLPLEITAAFGIINTKKNKIDILLLVFLCIHLTVYTFRSIINLI